MDNDIGLVRGLAVNHRRDEQFHPECILVIDIGGGTDEGDIDLLLCQHPVDLVVGGPMDHFRRHLQLGRQIVNDLLIIADRADRGNHAGDPDPQRRGPGKTGGKRAKDEEGQEKKEERAGSPGRNT